MPVLVTSTLAGHFDGAWQIKNHSEYIDVLKGVQKIPTENLISKQSSGQCVVADLLDQYEQIITMDISSQAVPQSIMVSKLKYSNRMVGEKYFNRTVLAILEVIQHQNLYLQYYPMDTLWLLESFTMHDALQAVYRSIYLGS